MYIVKQAESSATIHSLVNTVQISQQAATFNESQLLGQSGPGQFSSWEVTSLKPILKKYGFIPEKTDRER